jgi:hypothetical protein
LTGFHDKNQNGWLSSECKMSAVGDLFYFTVRASTAQWNSELLVGHYCSRELANRVGAFVRKYFTEIVKGDIGIRIEVAVAPPADPKIVVQRELSGAEQSRLMKLGLKPIAWKRA